VRFYERITTYWGTQVVEMIAFVVLLVAVIYVPVYRYMHLPQKNLWLVMIFAGLGLWVNAAFSKRALEQVGRATMDEIEEIHSCCMTDLEGRVGKVCAEYGLKFN